ncbi:calmodulin-like protein 5 [Lobosporangium transversale]|uniref:Calmodulin-like protein 5 n=1 Tax=Lobosporangium transversale TaxID=64571 RepID=A0A1Y2H2E2_9FUNG|nr:calmodulin-like protein 5 [Lobosporangium transversale]ORZ27883.1 calmodulin-like protein 5 [Lobosporangium transversale]|eukprot:XP_021885586.1 calmodulin-like protein 5 [Lobosporangium transversale]
MTRADFTESQIVNIKMQFKSMDKDGDGSITEGEFLDALKSSNRNPDEYDLQAFFNRADKNRDGRITFNEFLDACHELGLGRDCDPTGQPTKKSQKEIDAIFKAFDLDGNGYISPQELKQVMAKQGDYLSKEEIKEMIDAADTNRDGQIDREEFARMV